MTAWKLFCISWDFSPPVVIGCIIMLISYFWGIHFRVTKKSIYFTLAVLTILLALCSPLDKIGEDYLFSAHMMQHMMLGLLAPPLLVAGVPGIVRIWLNKVPILAKLEKFLGYPALALLIGSGSFWLWHLPRLYDIALENDTIHIIEHLTFLITGVMLWWPVFKPFKEGRLTPMPAVIYMGIATALGMILGIIFTLSDTPYYSAYAHPHDELGALKLIRDDWGLDQLQDQKLGGALMWEPMGAVFLWAMMIVTLDWFKDSGQSPPKTVNYSPAERRTEDVGS